VPCRSGGGPHRRRGTQDRSRGTRRPLGGPGRLLPEGDRRVGCRPGGWRRWGSARDPPPTRGLAASHRQPLPRDSTAPRRSRRGANYSGRQLTIGSAEGGVEVREVVVGAGIAATEINGGDLGSIAGPAPRVAVDLADRGRRTREEVPVLGRGWGF